MLIITSIITGIYIVYRPWPEIQVTEINTPENIPANETIEIEITAINKGNAAGSERISIKVDNKEFRSYLFSITNNVHEIIEQLNNEKIPEEVITRIEEEIFEPSDEIQIFVGEQEDNWVLHDGKKGYNLFLEKNEDSIDVSIDSRICFLEEDQKESFRFPLKFEKIGEYVISSGDISKKITVV